MTTAMVLNDYASDMLKQASQKYPLERKLSSPVGLQSLRRICTSSAASQLLANSPQKVLLSQMTRDHRKLDRSVSEPIDKPSQQQPKVPQANSTRYKTELCRPFEENGSCKYGEKCQFAHGPAELRMLVRHPKYKTELCRTFHSTGFCPYGPRCHFIHNDEKKNLVNQVTTSMQSLSTSLQANHRPKALSIGLGSTGDLSPTSSNSGSPTSSLNGFFMEEIRAGLHSPTSPQIYDFPKQQLSPTNSVQFADLGLLMDNFSPAIIPASMDSPTSQGEDPFPMENDHGGFHHHHMQQKCCTPLDARKLVRLPIFNLLAQ